MIIGLGSDFWICLVSMGVMFLFLFALYCQRVYWLNVANFSGLFGWCVQEGMLAGLGDLRKLSIGGIEEGVRLPLLFYSSAKGNGKDWDWGNC